MKTLALLHLSNCIQHSHLPSAEGFLSPQNLSYTALQWAYKKKTTEQIYPQFQNAVGILITAVLSLNFQASQNREKKPSLYTGPQDPTTI